MTEHGDIEQILRHAFLQRASDVHITVGCAPVMRIDGNLCALGESPLEPEDTESLVRQMLSDSGWQQLQSTGDLDFSYTIKGVSRLRVNVYRQRGCYGAAIRIIPPNVPSFDELGLPDAVRRFARNVQGLVLVTGSTGSGKSTTLAALVDSINQAESRHIVTLEDPIEYLHSHKKSLINQREIGIDTPSFASGLRSALRQNPDVILIGEMRDLETIQTAVTAAETGHLVLATLHTMSAPQTIERIIDVFPPHQQNQIRIQLASVLVGIVCQRLLQSTSGTGRIAACEVLVNTPAIANLIRAQKVHQISTVLQTSKAVGMQTMDMHVRELLGKGLVVYP